MALFGNKKKAKETKSSEKKNVPTKAGSGERNFSHILLDPRITEKAAIASGDGVYTFNVDSRANKKEIGLAIEQVYNVRPIKIRTIRVAPRVIRTRRGLGRKAGFKKAMVYLKPGTTIDFI